MVILGLTGSICMGKSTAANMFKQLDIPVFDADEVVHNLLSMKKIIQIVGEAFPKSFIDGVIDRKILGKQVFDNKQALEKLENILHPIVFEEKNKFIKLHEKNKADIVVLDIPLLFETEWDKFCDFVIVVDAPDLVQKTRALSRSGMTAEKFEKIKKQQMPNDIKRSKADFVVSTDLKEHETLQQLVKIIKEIREK